MTLQHTLQTHPPRKLWQWWLLLPSISVVLVATTILLALWHHPYSNTVNVAIILPISATNDDYVEQECSCPTTADLVATSRSSTDDTIVPSSFASTLGLQGNVSDCCCSFGNLERTNRDIVHPLLERVVSTPFFSHFKIDLCTSCKLWNDNPLCVLQDCAVCECDDPPHWANVESWMPRQPGPTVPDDDCQYQHVDDRVVTAVQDAAFVGDWDPTISFLESPEQDSNNNNENNQQTTDSEEEDNAVVVDLRLNPERYTGYGGQSAERVWTAIHQENCFQPESNNTDNNNDGCSDLLTPEQRVYNRILSGMHSSISLHVAHSYCLTVNQDRPWECAVWGLNTTVAHDRVLDHPDRLENLYATFALLLRAVQKAGSAITAAVPSQPQPQDDNELLYSDDYWESSRTEWTESLLPELAKLAETCPQTFDESSIFPLDENARLELQRRFQHLQQIMQCVGCDRCKLWGTLQSLGVGTALKVLLHDDTDNNDTTLLDLSRQEAVALVHTLERLSKSLVYATELSAYSSSSFLLS